MRYLARKIDGQRIELLDAEEIETFSLLPNDKNFFIEIYTTRDPQYHRKFRGFLNEVYNTMPEHLEVLYPTFEVFWKHILIATGMYRYRKIKGRKDIEFKSTSFRAMNEDEYRKFVKDTIRLIQKNYFNFNEEVLLELLTQYNYY